MQVTSSEDEVGTPLKNDSKERNLSDLSEDSGIKRSLINEFSSIAPTKKLKMFIKKEND